MKGRKHTELIQGNEPSCGVKVACEVTDFFINPMFRYVAFGLGHYLTGFRNGTKTIALDPLLNGKPEIDSHSTYLLLDLLRPLLAVAHHVMHHSIWAVVVS